MAVFFEIERDKLDGVNDIPELAEAEKKLREWTAFANDVSCKKEARPNGKVRYAPTPRGEMDVTKGLYDLMYALGGDVYKGEQYVIVKHAFMETLVDLSMPDSEMADPDAEYEEGKEVPKVRRVWKDYAPLHWDLGDGTYLVRCIHFKPGRRNGTGTTPASFRAWYEQFNGQILTKAEGQALLATVKEEME